MGAAAAVFWLIQNSEFRIFFSRDSYSNVFTVKTLVSQNFYLKVNRKNHRSKKSMKQWNLLIYVTNTAKEKVVLFQWPECYLGTFAVKVLYPKILTLKGNRNHHSSNKRE